MKKLFLSITAFAALMASSVAQDSDMSSSLKPTGGEKNIEVQFAPLGGSPISIGGLRVRSFSSATSAMRATVFIGYSSSSTITQQASAGVEELKNTNSSMTINLRPGIEKHFDGTDRLSPYVGAEVDIAFQSSTAETQTGGIAGAAVVTNTVKGQNGFLRFGLNGVAGCDYYFSKSIYLGTEVGFGFSYTSNSAVKTETDLAGAPTIPDAKQGGSFNLGPNVLGQIRLGYLF
jgi:outer membrane protein W